MFYASGSCRRRRPAFRALQIPVDDSRRRSRRRRPSGDRHDPRVTRIGRLMRATAMDELPQLWNIFRGDMSFVGPRALRPGEIESRRRRSPRVRWRTSPATPSGTQVRPGLTGIAQIFAPRDVPRRYKFKYDQIYVANAELLGSTCD